MNENTDQKIVNKNSLQQALNDCSTWSEVVLKIFPYRSVNGAYIKRCQEKSVEFCSDMTIFNHNNKIWQQANTKRLKQNKIGQAKTQKQVFAYGSNASGKSLRRNLIKSGIQYKCSSQGCTCKGQWLGKKITLQVDHISGDNNDNRIQNLRFLCPNCHSQTQTFAGRKKKIRHYCQCGSQVCKTGKQCVNCAQKINKKFDPTKQQLQKTLEENKFNMTKIGKFYNVSDNAVRKRCKKYGIHWKL